MTNAAKAIRLVREARDKGLLMDDAARHVYSRHQRLVEDLLEELGGYSEGGQVNQALRLRLQRKVVFENKEITRETFVRELHARGGRKPESRFYGAKGVIVVEHSIYPMNKDELAFFTELEQGGAA